MALSNSSPPRFFHERRRFPRLAGKAEARFRDLYKPHEKFSDSFAENLSVRGLRLLAPKFLPKDARLVALLSLPGVTPKPMRMICRVIWVRGKPFSERPCECGVEFIGITPEDRELLAGYIDKLL